MQHLIATSLLEHREQISEITASTIKVAALLPIELTRGERPILTERPPANPSTDGIDTKKKRLNIGREWMLTVNRQVSERIITMLPVRHVRAFLANVKDEPRRELARRMRQHAA